MQEALLRKVYWHEVRDDVSALKPGLAAIIDEIDPTHETFFIKAKYPFGAKLLHDGICLLPQADGTALPITHDKVYKDFGYHLDYSPVPVGIIQSKVLETFIEPHDRMVPLSLLEQGKIIGLWETLKPPTFGSAKRAWSINSGARSLFLLPKITDVNGHGKLKREYGIKAPVPKTLSEHWRIFHELLQSQAPINPWESEILFFSKNWFNDYQDNKWLKFKLCLLEHAWEYGLGARNKEIVEFIWEDLLIALEHKNLRPKPHIIDNFKHLLYIAIGVSPGFSPLTNKDNIAPVDIIQNIYLTDYGLKNYYPILMGPKHFIKENALQPVYYSLQSPTLLECYPRSKSMNSLINDMRELKILIDAVFSEINIEGTHLQHFLQGIHFDLFHTEADEYYDIRSTHDLFLEDDRFIMSHLNDDRVHAQASPFMRGCVRITYQK